VAIKIKKNKICWKVFWGSKPSHQSSKIVRKKPLIIILRNEEQAKWKVSQNTIEGSKQKEKATYNIIEYLAGLELFQRHEEDLVKKKVEKG